MLDYTGQCTRRLHATNKLGDFGQCYRKWYLTMLGCSGELYRKWQSAVLDNSTEYDNN